MSHKAHKHNSTSSWGSFKPILFIVVMPVLILFSVIALTAGRSSKTDEAGITNMELVESTYVLDKTQHSFGKISQRDGNVETEFELINTGSSDIYVKRLYTSCMCTKSQIIFSDGSKTGLNGMLGHGSESDLFVGKTIKAGETVKIKAIFDPNAHGPQGVGFIKRNLTLETNLKSSLTIQVSFDAEVIR